MLERVRSKHRRSGIVTPPELRRRYKSHRKPHRGRMDHAAGSPMESATIADGALPLKIALRTPTVQRGLPRAGGRRASSGIVGRDITTSSVPLIVDATRAVGRLSSVSRAMSDVFNLVCRLAPTNVTVTLTGETGTGKDVFAHLIHDQGSRATHPFVVFDCGAVPPNLIESELFGHDRGAFTGAHAEHPGAFERADGGTLFLDEIGELPLELQPRLLRVGGTRDRRVDVRIVAATNRDLAALAGTKQFRQDLYFRLAAAVIQLPALRDRLDDLPFLVPQLLRDLGHGTVQVSDEALAFLEGHQWPGNVRELKNALACALAFVDVSDGAVLRPRHLRLADSPVEHGALERLPLGGHALETIERVAIRQTVLHSGGNKVHAARTLGIAPSTLYEKLRKYGL
jgi:DNA-binding NtrC family response regulator